MAYAGTDYGSSGSWNNNAAGVSTQGISMSNLTAAHASAVIIGLSLLFLIALRMGFRGISVGKVTGGLVRG